MKSKSKKPGKAVVAVGRPKRKKYQQRSGGKRGKLTPAQRKKHLDVSNGNRWWEIRAKHGRDKIFKEPKILLEAAIEYIQWCNDNPEKRAELVKYEGDAEEKEVSVKRLCTMQGLCRYLHVNTEYFRQFKRALHVKDLESLTQEDRDFSRVITIIQEAIEDQQISGAASGFFNGNIISRLLGLVDKKDITTEGGPIASPIVKIYNTAPPLAGNEDDVIP